MLGHDYQGWHLLGYHDGPDGSSEGHGDRASLPRLRGHFNWIEDQTSDFDWRRWGERFGERIYNS